MVYIKKSREYLLHLGAEKDQFQKARSLRITMTAPERILWEQLRNRKMNGLKFRRQHPIHFYIADFYCHEKKLIIEVDGGVHTSKKSHEHDENRSAELERLGIKVIRITNEMVINSLPDAIDLIKRELGIDT